MELFPANSKIPFMKVRGWTIWLSVALMLASVASMVFKGFNFGLDFTGGALIEVRFPEATETEKVRVAAEAAGFRGASVQSYSPTEMGIKIRPEGSEATKVGEQAAKGASQAGATQTAADRLVAALNTAGLKATMTNSEFVGPQVGEELRNDGLLALIIVGIGIFIYVVLRFEWKFAAAAIACEVHDVVIILGIFSLFGIEFDLATLAAVLAIIGYSINDTIVVFDRVREMFLSARKMDTIELFDESINTTLSRTIITSLTTLFTALSLYFLGGEVLQGFSLCLVIGIVLGTLSSIFFACPVLLLLGTNKRDLIRDASSDPRLAELP
jgi:preprotein translocase subunit SecF